MRLIFFAQAAKTFSDQVDTFSTALFSEKKFKNIILVIKFTAALDLSCSKPCNFCKYH